MIIHAEAHARCSRGKVRPKAFVDPASSATLRSPSSTNWQSTMYQVVESVCEHLAVVLSDVRSFGITGAKDLSSAGVGKTRRSRPR